MSWDLQVEYKDSDWTVIPATHDVPSYRIFNEKLLTPPNDDRLYKMIKLENGLNAIVVHDPDADISAASMDVAIGHLSDPDDVPGLAHFCEHLLFMGTKKYPRENEYNEFLNKNNGSSNAYTGPSSTNFHFSVSSSKLLEALERFSAFFYCPLFDESCTAREINAVDSEHRNNLQNDNNRLFSVMKALAKEGSVWRKFGSGNKKTLSRASAMVNSENNKSITLDESKLDGGPVGIQIRRRLIEWWEGEYYAGRMNLCVIGKESTEELLTMVAKLFSPIRSSNSDPRPMLSTNPYGSEVTGSIVAVRTIVATHGMDIMFHIPYELEYHLYKPDRLISHLMGHEGTGSLHSHLKHKGWITDIACGAETFARGFTLYNLNVSLTKDGLQNYKTILELVFRSVSLIREKGIEESYQNEICDLEEIDFRYSEKSEPDEYATFIADQMPNDTYVLRQNIISSSQLTRKWDDAEKAKAEIKTLLEKMDPEHAIILLTANEEDLGSIDVGRPGQDDWKKEDIYGVLYRVQKLEPDLITRGRIPIDDERMVYPMPNKYIPTEFDVDKYEVTEPAKRPTFIHSTPSYSLWHKKDDQFWMPRVNLSLQIFTPITNSTPRHAVLTRLFVDLINDALTETSYDAHLAGLSYSLSGFSSGLNISLSGYSHRLLQLAKHVFETVKDYRVDIDRLEVMKEQYKIACDNWFLRQPYEIGDSYATHIMSYKTWRVEERAREIESVSAKEIQDHASALLRQSFSLILAIGNIDRQRAIELSDLAQNIFGSSPFPNAQTALERALILPEACNYIHHATVPNEEETNNSLTYYLHIGSYNDPRLRVVTSLLAHIMAEPVFDTLRTKEQLGYLVISSMWCLPGDAEFGLRLSIQSNRTPDVLEERVDSFVESFRGTLEGMNDADLDEHKASVKESWEQKLKNLDEEMGRFWEALYPMWNDFLRQEQDAKLLQSVTKAELIELFDAKVHPSAPRRSKLSVHMHSQVKKDKGVVKTMSSAMGDLAKATLSSFKTPSRYRTKAVTIDDIPKFKTKLKLSEEARPLVEWSDLESMPAQ